MRVSTLVCFSALIAVAVSLNKQYLSRMADTSVRMGDAADASDPLILTKYLSNPEQGRQLALVPPSVWKFPSYSGYFTVNATANANTFFWFFPAQSGNTDAPVLVWLQGGPGVSSMFGLFTELGPFRVTPDLKLVDQPYNWNADYSLIFIDNPVGVGFSFVDQAFGYVHDQVQVGECLYRFIEQFFVIFNAYAAAPFYVTGESYAGKYVPAFTYTIDKYNRRNPAVPINLYGMSVGDGIIEPTIQFTAYAELLYEIGMIDATQRAFASTTYEQRIVGAIQAQDWIGGFWLLDQYLNGDFTNITWFNNITGTTNYLNFLDPPDPVDPFADFLNLPATRAALHVGSVPYWAYNKTVEWNLLSDWMKTYAPWWPTILDNYKVLVYNGQLDIILGPGAAEKVYNNMPWTGLQEFLSAPRRIWKVDSTDPQVAGYAKHAGNFTYCSVRLAGHMVPTDVPRVALDMITRFINNAPF